MNLGVKRFGVDRGNRRPAFPGDAKILPRRSIRGQGDDLCFSRTFPCHQVALKSVASARAERIRAGLNCWPHETTGLTCKAK